MRTKRQLAWALGIMCISFVLLPVGQGTQERAQDDTGEVVPYSPLPAECWLAIYQSGVKIGHSVMRHRPLDQSAVGSPRLVEWTQETELRIVRSGNVVFQTVEMQSVERPDGTVEQYRVRQFDGNQSMGFVANREGDQLHVRPEHDPKSPVTVINGTGALRGFFAIEQSLAERPMHANEQRVLTVLLPMCLEPATVRLAAVHAETTWFPDGHELLLRIEGNVALGTVAAVSFTCWQNEVGRIVKMGFPGIGQTLIAANKEQALSDDVILESRAASPTDLDLNARFPVDGIAVNPHEQTQMAYHLRVDRGPLAGIFTSSSRQRVEGQRDGSVVIHVGAPPAAGSAEANLDARIPGKVDVATPGDLRANPWIDWEDPIITGMANNVAPNANDPMSISQALSTHVNQWIIIKDYGRSFDTASTVARERRGDCTEHAVLLAALCRARGIPARLVFGLVYLPSQRLFTFHAWTEVWIDQQWVSLDATLGASEVGAAHIKVRSTNLNGTTPAMAILPLTQLMGRGLSIHAQPVHDDSKVRENGVG